MFGACTMIVEGYLSSLLLCELYLPPLSAMGSVISRKVRIFIHHSKPAAVCLVDSIEHPAV